VKNILLIGKTGNLGFEINKYFEEKNYKVFSAVRNPISPDDFLIKPNESINLPKDMKIDLIINAANRYYVDPEPEEVLQMHDSIIGIAQSIYLSNFSCPIIYFSSYLQYLPDEMQPWSDYTIIKSKATEIFNTYGKDRRTVTLELVLYDNYGGKRKDKFFDLAIDSAMKQTDLQATRGETVVNLTHVFDIVKSLESSIISDLFNSINHINHSYSIYSADLHSLKHLVDLIEEVLKVRVPVKWGAIPYRGKEVFEFYKSKPLLPRFLQENILKEYILFRAGNRSSN
jgi:nucleoside-diphosphate-sugar epimerase